MKTVTEVYIMLFQVIFSLVLNMSYCRIMCISDSSIDNLLNFALNAPICR